MNDRFHHNTLMRLHCDGELSPQQALELQRCLEADPAARDLLHNQVEVQKRLKECVRAAMVQQCPGAPKSLCDCVKAALIDVDLKSQISESVQDGENAVIGRIDGTSRALRDVRDSQKSSLNRFFTSTQRMNFIAVAATLALVVGAVLLGIFGRTIDDGPRFQNSTSDLVSKAVVFADQEHGQCVNAQGVRDATQWLNASQSQTQLSQWLDTPVTVFDLQNAGYEFITAKSCEMPVPGRSGHLIYRKIAQPGQPQPMLSVYVVPNTGGCKDRLCTGLEPGKWCAAVGKSQCVHRVLRATNGKLVYFLVCCDDSDVDVVAQEIALLPTPASTSH